MSDTKSSFEPNWMSPEEYRAKFSQAPWAHIRLDGIGSISLSAQRAFELIPSDPADSPPNEGDFPGPTWRWYGELGDAPFLLDSPHDESWSILLFPLEALEQFEVMIEDVFGMELDTTPKEPPKVAPKNIPMILAQAEEVLRRFWNRNGGEKDD